VLSSCYTELWRHMRTQDGSDTEASVAHLDHSRRWLQLVYDRLSEDSPDTLITISPLVATRLDSPCQPILSVIYECFESLGSIAKILLTCGPSNECWKMRSVSKAQHGNRETPRSGCCMTSKPKSSRPQNVSLLPMHWPARIRSDNIHATKEEIAAAAEEA
jgi:hypothetical protein